MGFKLSNRGLSTYADIFQGVMLGEVGQGTVRLDEEAERVTARAPNAIEWCIGAEWCNSPILFHFQRSYQTIRDYFELRCPTCNTGGIERGQPGDCWRKSRTYLEAETLLVWHPENEEDTCPGCGNTRSAFIEDGLMTGYNQMHLVVGMRAGKSMTAALIGTYAEHIFLSIAHRTDGGIHGHLGITPAEQFEITYIASNQITGNTTIWAKYNGFRRNAPWFQRYVPWIRKQEKAQAKFGMRPWRYNEGATAITNEHPKVRLIINSLNTNSGGAPGRTRVHNFIDELARMKQTSSAQGAEEVYRVTEASLRTIRSRVKQCGGMPWFGSMISVTSPISRDDKSMQLLRQAPKITDMYARHYPTWDFNPFEPRVNFDGDFLKDPIAAARDFGAQPAGAEYPLIHDEERWYFAAVDQDAQPIADFKYVQWADQLGHDYISVLVKSVRPGQDMRSRYVVFDAGQNFDSFAGACAHREYGIDEEGNEFPLTVYDWIMRALPRPGTEIWFASVVQLLKTLQPRTRFAFVAFDRWNSVQIIQDVRRLGIPSEQQTLKDADCVTFKGDCYENRVQLLPPAPGEFLMEGGNLVFPLDYVTPPPQMHAQTCAIYELLGLQRDPDTGKVYNPEKGTERGYNSDDAARVVMHVHKLVQHADYTERFDDRTKRAARRRAEHGGGEWIRGAGGRVAHVPQTQIQKPGGGQRGW